LPQTAQTGKILEDFFLAPEGSVASSKTYGRLCPCRTNPFEICPSEAVTTFVLLLVGGDGEDWRENSNFKHTKLQQKLILYNNNGTDLRDPE